MATPGRLEDFLGRKLVNFRSLRVLVLDEADRMLDMGFLPAIRRIAGVLPKERQTMCFSATLEASVAHLVHDYMRNPVRLAFGSILKPSENVQLQAFEVSSDRKFGVLHRLLAREKGRCLVFVRTKHGTERLTKSLNREGIAAAMIHGGRSQSQRSAALAGFQQGRIRVLIATDLACLLYTSFPSAATMSSSVAIRRKPASVMTKKTRSTRGSASNKRKTLCA